MVGMLVLMGIELSKYWLWTVDGRDVSIDGNRVV